eukprot:3932189-Rhodomonas_salina.1
MDSQTLDHISRGNVSAVSSFLSQLGTKKRSAASILSTVIDNTTALHAAVCAPRGSSVELVSMLLSAGAPADTREPCESRTALHIALARGELRAAALLLQGGGSLEAKDKQGLTPVDLVSALLSKGMWEAGGGACFAWGVTSPLASYAFPTRCAVGSNYQLGQTSVGLTKRRPTRVEVRYALSMCPLC